MSAEIAFEREQGTVHNRPTSTNQPKIQEPPRVVHTWQLWHQPAYARFVQIPQREKGFKVRALEKYLRSDAGRKLSYKAEKILRLLIDAAGPEDRRYADGRLCCATWAGYKYLAERLDGAHTDTVKRGVAELVRAGIVSRTRVYRLNSITIVEIPNVDEAAGGVHPGEINGAEKHQQPGLKSTSGRGENAPTHTPEVHSPESDPLQVKNKPCGDKVGGVVATPTQTNSGLQRMHALKHVTNVLTEIGTPVATQLQIRRHCVDDASCTFALVAAIVVSILPEITPRSKYAEQGPESPAVRLACTILRKLWDSENEQHFRYSIWDACSRYAEQGTDGEPKKRAAWVVNQCMENEDLACMLFGPDFDPCQ